MAITDIDNRANIAKQKDQMFGKLESMSKDIF